MRVFQLALFFCLALVLGMPTVSQAAVVGEGTVLTNTETAPTITAEDYESLSRKEKRDMRRQIRKDLKQQLKQVRKDRKDGKASDISTGLLVIIAILLPPLAMALYDGITGRFWISLLLTLLFYIPGLIYTLIVILGGK